MTRKYWDTPPSRRTVVCWIVAAVVVNSVVQSIFSAWLHMLMHGIVS